MPSLQPSGVYMTDKHTHWCEVASFEDLLAHEDAIVKRINAIKNGGSLFLCHPLETLDDIGVKVSDRVCEGLLQSYPELRSCSKEAYNAMKQSADKQTTSIIVNRLFERRET